MIQIPGPDNIILEDEEEEVVVKQETPEVEEVKKVNIFDKNLTDEEIALLSPAEKKSYTTFQLLRGFLRHQEESIRTTKGPLHMINHHAKIAPFLHLDHKKESKIVSLVPVATDE